MRIVATLLFLFAMKNAVLTPVPGDFKAWVEIVNDTPTISFVGKFLNNSENDVRLSYRLKTEKRGHSGCSVSNQSGSFLAPVQHEVSLSKMVVNLQPGDSCTTTLFVLNGETIVASDSVLFHGDALEGR